MKQKLLNIIYKILAFYAKQLIKKHNPFVVAITGSVGKTSAKEAIYEVLKDHFGSNQVRKNFGNLNAEIGIPLTILGYESVPNNYSWPIFLIIASKKMFVRQYPKYLVLEMGVEHKGDIESFCKITKPDIAIVTSISPAHLTNFNDVDEYQKEKISLISNLKSRGVAVVNGDEIALSQLRSERVKTISLDDKSSDIYIENYQVGLRGTEFRIASIGHKICIKSNLIGKHFIYSQLFGFAVGKILDFPLLSVAKSIEKIKSIPGRMNLIEGDDFTILDDTYNANPCSVKAALDTMESIEHKGRKVAIIGNMNELGALEQKAHVEVAEYSDKKVDLAIFVGPNANKMKEARKGDSLVFKNRNEFLKCYKEIIKSADLVLVKASQNKNFFEEIVKELMKDKSNIDKKLVRQSNFWLNKKNSY